MSANIKYTNFEFYIKVNKNKEAFLCLGDISKPMLEIKIPYDSPNDIDIPGPEVLKSYGKGVGNLVRQAIKKSQLNYISRFGTGGHVSLMGSEIKELSELKGKD